MFDVFAVVGGLNMAVVGVKRDGKTRAGSCTEKRKWRPSRTVFRFFTVQKQITYIE